MNGFRSVSRNKRSKWGPNEPKTVMNNIAHILPSNLSPDILHSLLLRFQFEEVQYKLEHLEEEVPNVYLNDSGFYDNKSAVPIDVRVRDSLVNERRQVIDAIERVFPAFRAPLSIRLTSTKIVKKITVQSSSIFGKIVGRRGTTLASLEQNNKVRISLRTAPKSPDGVEIENQAFILIIGTVADDINRCEQQIIKLIEAEQGKNTAEIAHVDPKTYALSFDPEESIPPWAYINIQNLSTKSEIDEALSDFFSEKGQDKIEEEVNILSAQEREKFNIDISKHDLSTILSEPYPPGYM